MRNKPVHIIKFGGTSLQDHIHILQAAQIVKERTATARLAVVVSAMATVTDTLSGLAAALHDEPTEAVRIIEELHSLHLDTLSEIQQSDAEGLHRGAIDDLFAELGTMILQKPEEAATYGAWSDRILSVGERASIHLFSAALERLGVPAKAVESNRLVKTDSCFGEAGVDFESTRSRIREALLLEGGEVPVISGFIGSNEEDQITTLGRSGSDFSASLVADALGADELEIWTDVDGILTADPKLVPTARHIGHLSYDDIEELARHGAKVIHPKTVYPLRDKSIPMRVKNSFNPDHPGTVISSDYPSNGNFRSLAITGPFLHVQVRASDSLGVLSALREAASGQQSYATPHFTSIDVKDHTVNLLLEEAQYNLFRKVLDDYQTHRQKVYQLRLFSNEHLNGQKLNRRILSLLSQRNIRPVEFHKSHGKRYSTLLVEAGDTENAARLLNDHLCAAEAETIELFVAGVGAVGGTLVQMLDDIQPEFNIRLLGVCDSSRTLWNEFGLQPGKAAGQLHSGEGETTGWENILSLLGRSYRHNTIFVDATGSAEVARLYPKLLEAGVHIATPSKRANTFEQAFYDRLQQLSEGSKREYRYETTVGAGLPVISTINDLLESGDEITEISGAVSGTMTYLFNELEKGVPFSQAVVRARELGYAEPDPRDDLSGEDAARKFLTLARTIGYTVEREEISVESLIPEKLADVDREAFLEQLKAYDGQWKQRVKQAQKTNKKLCYIGRLSQGEITIGISEVPQQSALGGLRGTDNLIKIYSKRYNQTPLIIQGPGAGKEVTAAGVLADILKIAREIL